MSGSVQYKHRPLRHPDAIRLCRVLPQADAASPIQISLSSYRLSDPKLDFIALSYTWGDESDKVPISVGGSGAFLPVPRSAVEALTVLRLDKKRQLFWVDAICIDQDSTQEKSVQVRMMGRIFNKAPCTTIYLGPHTESSKIVFQEVLDALHSPKVKDIYGRVRPDRSPPDDNVIRGLDELFQRPWFQRVWVLQEVHMSRHAQVLCGDSLVPKQALINCIFGYCWNRVTKRPVPFALQTWLMERNLRRSSTLWDKLWKCLYLTRESLATNPRDKLFALRAFLGPPEAKDDDSFVADFENLIDYGKSLEEVLETLASTFIQFIGLRILVGVRHGHDRQMPSWVPDWSQNLPLNYAFFEDYAFIEEHVQAVDRVTSRKYHPRDPRSLNVQGWRWGQIHEMGSAFSFDDLEDAKHQISRVSSILTAENFSETIRTGEREIIEAGLSVNILKVLREMDMKGMFEFFTRDNAIGALFTIADFSDVQTQDADDSYVIMEALQGCRLVLCGPSHISIAPRSAKEGDILVSFEDAHMPCLIRPSSNSTWTLISGDCYTFSLDPLFPLNQYGQCDAHTAEFLRDNVGEPEDFHLS